MPLARSNAGYSRQNPSGDLLRRGLLRNYNLAGFLFPASGRFGANREPDCKAATLSHVALHRDAAPLLLDQAVADRQPEPGPLADRFGGKERLEQAAHVFVGNPRSFVA